MHVEMNVPSASESLLLRYLNKAGVGPETSELQGQKKNISW